jgi:hypothetical protein
MSQIFTHILCVKLIVDTQEDELFEDEKLLQIIKDLITYKPQIEPIPYNNSHDIEVLIEWKQVRWNKTYSYLIEGDIITNTCYSDEQIELHTQRMLKGIELFIKTQYTEINNNKWKIIYHLSKPIDQILTNKLSQN